MDAVKFIKGAATLVVSTGVGAIVKNAVKATTPYDITRVSKIGVWVGAAVVSSMVADNATTYVKEKIDKGVQAVKDAQVPDISSMEKED